ncbi:MAG: hypothetical protein MUE40_06820 [Anaerolineae bacterium]|jgi:hypothetical protein|nr:hypothetical protein [Anaerolineae bacterium]
MAREETTPLRPAPRRPRYGWQAWEATSGYIATHHSPDVMLKIEIYPMGGVVGWAAAFSWGAHAEAVQDGVSFGATLTELWAVVERNHPSLFSTPEAAVRRPVAYDDDHWLDSATFEIFSRLVGVTEVAFRGNWRLMIVYQPVDTPETRVQARLLANDNTVIFGGRGPTLRDACRSLFRTAAGRYRAFLLRQDES